MRAPVFGIHVPRRWLRLLYIGDPGPLAYAGWPTTPPAVVGGPLPMSWPVFLFTPAPDEGASLVKGEAIFPKGVKCAFWQSSTRAAICPRYGFGRSGR